MLKNLESTRDNALLKQQIQYLTEKNEERNKIIEDNQKRYEEKLFTLRNEVEKDLNEKFERIKKEKTEVENKLLNKKKEMKELEQNFLKQETSNNKEKNDLSEKLNSLQKKYDELIINYNTEKNSNLTQINLLTKEKMEISDEKLCAGLPVEFVNYMKYVKNLDFVQEPDYKYLKGLFINILSTNEMRRSIQFFFG